MGGVDMLVAINEQGTRQAIDALVKGMVVMNRWMLGRYVCRDG